MLNRIIEASLQNRFLVVLATVMAIGWGVYAIQNTPLDAIPDLSDVQVIIMTEYPGQAPQVVEDQVTYPLTTAMLSSPYATKLHTQERYNANLFIGTKRPKFPMHFHKM